MPKTASVRSRLAPALRPVRQRLSFWSRARRKVRYFRDGIEGIAAELRDTPNQHVAILREYGATVGQAVAPSLSSKIRTLRTSTSLTQR